MQTEKPVENNTGRQKLDVKAIIFLQVLLVFGSLSGVFSKMASREPFFSFKFFVFYALLIFVLGINAIALQQVLKKIPLTVSYCNKAIGIIWGLIWGVVFFGEVITLKKVIGGLIVIIGIILYSMCGLNAKE